MEMLDARRNQHRPAPAPAADVEPNTAAGRQTMPGKDAEIIVEDRLTLLVREVIRVLPEVRPLMPEAARNPQVNVVVSANLHIAA
jgi:hypothetical protein